MLEIVAETTLGCVELVLVACLVFAIIMALDELRYKQVRWFAPDAHFQDPICFDCARLLGLVPCGHNVGVWPDTCVVCQRPANCTARRDWYGSRR